MTTINQPYTLYPYQTTSTSNITYTFPQHNSAYVTFKLPINLIPNKVYIRGELMSFGVLGSNSQVAYANNMLIIAPKVIQGTVDTKVPISIDYGNYLYHYNIYLDNSTLGVKTYPNTNTADSQLLSRVKQR